ncbi:peptidylprolyl isomerase [Commensalibacter papalotli (ex Botero et al. 2024)]|uniref:Parvulin-like PPIase n=1 Tax=Commensalibacter papalotli (ex Botero et al. 2024) TaxID=2972766 RepID=A0ABM9HIB6_9PROT|nr:peptidylprolyl isomerase [Commensalibacter papalotli (ex Botero et al. 2024)]CAI3924450.1 Peptidyl-prolyl isomerase [Commensalibacter papalotli (ex Botero et al. 2024)]CAI3927625.1 Peptidyl-prolyl isomerase [Commensalibacter papalotli (ex Botero et al. 2024)]
MLSRLRHLLIDSWLGRILVGLIFLVFISWGAETIIESWSQRDGNVVAWVGSQRVTMQELDSAAKMQLQQYATQQGFSDPSQVPNVMRGSLVNQALQQLIIQKNLIAASEHAGLSVSDETLRNLIFSLPVFQTNGKFSRELFNVYVKQTNMTEAAFLDILRNQIAISGLTEPVTAGATTSDIMVKSIFAFRNETRKLTYIKLPFSQFKAEATPSDAVLKRYYDNHLWEFTVPEFRRIRMIFFTPETVEKSIEVSDADAQQYFNSRKQEFNKPESKNLEIITVKDKKTAEDLAGSWTKEPWENIQKETQKANGFATTLNEFTHQTSPSAELADAVQKAPLNIISAPIKTPMGWSVFKVTAIIPPHEVAFDTVKDKLKAQITQARAKQKFVDNIKSTQDMLAGSTGRLDDEGVKYLGGKGIVALRGTLNEQGLNLDGQPAPIPSDDKVKQAILGNVFSKAKDAPASLIQGDNNIYYAFFVEDIDPAHQQTFEQAKDRVIKAWQQANIKRQANITGTAIYKQTQDSQKSVKELVNQQFQAKESESFSRVNPSKTLPAELQAQAFLMQIGQTTMLESPDSFYIATLDNIKKPEPQDDQASYNALRDTLKQAESNDIYNSYVIFINKEGKVDVNQKAVNNIIGQGSN